MRNIFARKSQKKEIPKKNYLIVLAIFALTVLIVLLMVRWYKNSQDMLLNNTIMKGFLAEVKEDEIDNYLMENPNILIYFTSSSNQSIKDFEKDFKRKISKEDLNNEIVYVDLDEVSKDFLSTFKNKYFEQRLKDKNFELMRIPNLILIRENEVIDVLYKSDYEINMDDVSQFLEIYEMVDA